LESLHLEQYFGEQTSTLTKHKKFHMCKDRIPKIKRQKPPIFHNWDKITLSGHSHQPKESTMYLISVNLGQERPFDNKTGRTGIYKFAVDHPVAIHSLGVTGDAVSDQKNHGGPDQAVYVYGGADYDWWAQELGRTLPPGMFGENLTISELESAEFLAGDCLQVGAVTLQVTAPRIPCSTFAARMEDSMFVKRFRQAERPGLYCRVLKTGTVQAGDPVSLQKWTGPAVTIRELYNTWYEPKPAKETLLRHLAAPIAIRARTEMEERLAKVTG